MENQKSPALHITKYHQISTETLTFPQSALPMTLNDAAGLGQYLTNAGTIVALHLRSPSNQLFVKQSVQQTVTGDFSISITPFLPFRRSTTPSTCLEDHFMMSIPFSGITRIVHALGLTVPASPAPCAEMSKPDRRVALLTWILSMAVSFAGRGAELSLAPQLPHTNLLVYRKSDGEIVPVKTKADWQRRRAEILERMQSIMGTVPGTEKRCALDVKAETEAEQGPYIRRYITYASEPGSRVPAWLLIPKAALQSNQKCPAVLALHPTDMEYGHRVVVEDLRAHYRAYARDLAERGFVVIAPAYPLMANYQPELKALGYQSGTMKAIWDNMRALDLLETLPFVKKGLFGAIGHSLGGHNAIFTAVLDPRLKVVVSSCGFDSFFDYMDGNITGWTSDRYMPKLRQFSSRLPQIPFDFYELIGALVPSPVFISAPLNDTNFKSHSVEAIVRAAGPIYRLYGVPQNLRLVQPDCGHDFPPEVREEAYQFLSDALR